MPRATVERALQEPALLRRRCERSGLRATRADPVVSVCWEPRYRLEVRRPVLTPTNASDSRHFRLRSLMAGELNRMFSFLVPDDMRPETPLTRAAVTFTRASAGRCDYDGVVYSGKYVIDCLCGRASGRRKIISDDSHDVIGRPEYLSVNARRGFGFVELCVEDRAPWVWSRS